MIKFKEKRDVNKEIEDLKKEIKSLKNKLEDTKPKKSLDSKKLDMMNRVNKTKSQVITEDLISDKYEKIITDMKMEHSDWKISDTIEKKIRRPYSSRDNYFTSFIVY